MTLPNIYFLINKSLADDNQNMLEHSFPWNLGSPLGPTQGPHTKFWMISAQGPHISLTICNFNKEIMHFQMSKKLSLVATIWGQYLARPHICYSWKIVKSCQQNVFLPMTLQIQSIWSLFFSCIKDLRVAWC